MITVTRTLISSFQPAGDEVETQTLYRIIPQLKDKLGKLLASLAHSPEQREAELALIEDEHVKILKGEPLDCVPCDLIDNTNPLSAPNTAISKGLLKPVTKLESGQWFLQQQDEEQRLRLAIKLEDAQQLLFVNMLGGKAGQYSFEEFAYQLSSRIVKPLKVSVQPKSSHLTLIGKLLSKLEKEAAYYYRLRNG